MESKGRSVLDTRFRGYDDRLWSGVAALLLRRDDVERCSHARDNGLLRGACHRARIRATRWLAMTRSR
jgi:hypothetical protein